MHDYDAVQGVWEDGGETQIQETCPNTCTEGVWEGGVGWGGWGGGVLRVNECMRTREVIHTGCEEVDVSGQCGVPFERGFES